MLNIKHFTNDELQSMISCGIDGLIPYYTKDDLVNLVELLD
jgi:hypothetical protein